MPSTAPLTRARIAARRNGTRNHVGSRVPSVPMGSATIPADSSSDEPASSSPNTTSSTGATAPPKVFQPTMAAPGASRCW